MPTDARHELTDHGSEVTLLDWVARELSDMPVTTASEPHPVLLDHNVIAVSMTPEVVRAVTLEFERIQPKDGSVGFVALGTAADEPNASSTPATDPEHVTGHTANRIVKGAVPGAIIGAAVVCIAVLAIGERNGILIGAGLGGAAFGAIAGAVLSFVVGTGWGSAYRDSFVEPERTGYVVASIHSDDDEPIAEALDAVASMDDLSVFRVDRLGRPA